MTAMRATYRLQFRDGMDFDRAAALVPYLQELGISHLYASPLFQAVGGSNHGYDVTDHGKLDESLGGMEGFLRLSAALKEAGLGLILDIVPNHMAASPENAWWRDVLRHGPKSAHADHFDIDWSAPRLLLPLLGQPYGKTLAAGELAFGREADGPVLTYFEHAFPLDPRSWKLVLGPGGPAPTEGNPADSAARFARWIADPANAKGLDERLAALSRDHELIDRVHEAQPWRLSYWRAGRDALTYRRFFEISDLVGVRVEDPVVFGDVHRFLFELIAAGHVDGLRIDHVDGLADPAAYLARLKKEAPGNPPIWVEKILAPGEELPVSWPVQGTTGYEFGRLAADLLTNPRGAPTITAAYHDFIGAAPDPERMLAETKRQILTWNLAAELESLTRLAGEAAAGDRTARDRGPDTLRRALVALASAMPIYRTYVTGDEIAKADAAVLDRAGKNAREEADLEDPGAVDDLQRLMRSGSGPASERLRMRFQQTTGALMAKAMEDTLFYRYNRLVSANEVGGEVDPLGIETADFHRAIAARAARQPHGLNATATHDTKRGEDARMRIAAIAEAPDDWHAAVVRWDARLAAPKGPDAEMRWLFYQALLGAWDPTDREGLAKRLSDFMLKAAREAKLATNWTHQDAGYETRLTEFVTRALGDDVFVAAFDAGTRPFIVAGARKSLVQTALKLLLPGVPDLYQGTARADLSLVDPDNRRPVDFEARQAALENPASAGWFDTAKTSLIRRLLALRTELHELFAGGSYHPLEVDATGGRFLGAGRMRAGNVVLFLGELSPPARRVEGEPSFEVPPEWRDAKFEAVWPQVGFRYNGRMIAPEDAFEGNPVLVLRGSLDR